MPSAKAKKEITGGYGGHFGGKLLDGMEKEHRKKHGC